MRLISRAAGSCENAAAAVTATVARISAVGPTDRCRLNRSLLNERRNSHPAATPAARPIGTASRVAATPDQLVAIADVQAPKAGAPLTEDARDTLRQQCTEIYNDIDGVTGLRRIDLLGNGRFIRRIIKHASTARNRRLVASGVDLDRIEEHTELIGDDIKRGVSKAAEAETEESRFG